MTATTIIGIDPGATGAIAAIHPSLWAPFDEPDVFDMPATAADLVGVLSRWHDQGVQVFLEQAQSMPGQGVSSTFKYGVGFGQILGVLAALGIAHRQVSPAVWKRQMGVTKDKDKARALAQQLFPTASLARVKDHGRAEALLIAEWGRRHG